MAEAEILPPAVGLWGPANRAPRAQASVFGLKNTAHHKESDKLNMP